jgi:16S rRNA (cytidine1402-2'-O)-methyltransferase
LKPGLYVVATPIGNLGDMTLRAQTVLAGADLIACEDTRLTARLLQHCGITTPMQAYHDHNAPRVRPGLLERLSEGGRIALVSDAGTPGIADPGFRLVREARRQGSAIHAVPGPSALSTAIMLAPVESDIWTFAGFLPAKAGARTKRLRDLAEVPGALVFFESPQRLPAALQSAHEVLGDRSAAVLRELTKLYETVVEGRLSELMETFAEPPRGEIVLVIAPPAPAAVPDEETLREALQKRLAAGDPPKTAAGHVARATGADKRRLYDTAVALKKAGA